jgi:methyl coenzyme M reductase subunit D
MMSEKSKTELVENYRSRYLKANKTEKTRVITQIQEAAGMNRITIIRKMHASEITSNLTSLLRI